MSRIYFHSPSGDVAVRGSERAHMGILLRDVAAAAFDTGGGSQIRDDNPLFTITHFRKDQYDDFGGGLRFASDFRLWLAHSGPHAGFATPAGKIDAFSVILNTALAVGGDPLKLIARLHGQCEVHAWVTGQNRAWIADIIERGRRYGLMRDGQGWEALVDFLRARADEPVVTSYSVTDSFPNAHAAGSYWNGPGDFYELADAEQWRLAMLGLAADPGGLELRPDLWDFPDFWFSHTPQNAFTLMAPSPATATAPAST